MDFQSNFTMTIGGKAFDTAAHFDVMNPAMKRLWLLHRTHREKIWMPQ
jgi:hypothetical protein